MADMSWEDWKFIANMFAALAVLLFGWVLINVIAVIIEKEDSKERLRKRQNSFWGE